MSGSPLRPVVGFGHLSAWCAEFLGLGGSQDHATVDQSATFLDVYMRVRAFDAKEAAGDGDPVTVLAQPEARARLELAGLDPDLV